MSFILGNIFKSKKGKVQTCVSPIPSVLSENYKFTSTRDTYKKTPMGTCGFGSIFFFLNSASYSSKSYYHSPQTLPGW